LLRPCPIHPCILRLAATMLACMYSGRPYAQQHMHIAWKVRLRPGKEPEFRYYVVDASTRKLCWSSARQNRLVLPAHGSACASPQPVPRESSAEILVSQRSAGAEPECDYHDRERFACMQSLGGCALRQPKTDDTGRYAWSQRALGRPRPRSAKDDKNHFEHCNYKETLAEGPADSAVLDTQ
jgi:hypothetical protein